ncbi:MAG: methyltransferase family protein [Promethearchaeota archaeon]
MAFPPNNKKIKIKSYINSLVKVLIFFVFAVILSVLLANFYVILKDVILPFLYPFGISIPFPYNLGGLLVIVLGLGLNAWANYTFLVVRKIGFYAREPFRTPSKLVVEGPFRFSRNPIYLSVLTISSGFAILLGSFTAFLAAPIALFIIFQIWFIRWEEKKLEEKFGKDYLEYKKRVRRWL